MLLLAVMGFWGMIYPDLCFVEDVCMVYITEEAEECTDTLPADMFTRLCAADPAQIQVKSKLIEVITERKADSDVVDKR